jgi:hypothetical protein
MKLLRDRPARSSPRPCFKLEALDVRCEWIVEDVQGHELGHVHFHAPPWKG